MSTLTEIKRAAATLPPEDLAQLETFLHELRACSERDSELAEIVRQNGVHPLPRRSNTVITTEMTLQLCEEESI